MEEIDPVRAEIKRRYRRRQHLWMSLLSFHSSVLILQRAALHPPTLLWRTHPAYAEQDECPACCALPQLCACSSARPGPARLSNTGLSRVYALPSDDPATSAPGLG